MMKADSENSLRLAWLSIFIGLGTAGGGIGCSSEISEDGSASGVDGGQASGGGGNASSGGRDNVGVGGSSTGGTGTGSTNSNLDVELPTEEDEMEMDEPPSDGGKVLLTPEQVTDIQGAACTGWTAEGETLPATLQLVVDVSLSMSDPAPGGGGSKWEVTQQALESAIDSLPPSVSLGVLFYPNLPLNGGPGGPGPGPGAGGSGSGGSGGSGGGTTDLDECVNTEAMVPIDQLGEEGSAHRMLVAQAFADATIDGFTPTHDAYRHALEDALIPFEGVPNQFMLLITDGAPTMRLVCDSSDPDGGEPGGGGIAVFDQPTQPIVDEVEAASTEHDIRTFLIGSPGSQESSESEEDMRPWLSAAAVAGGTAPDGCEPDGPNFCHMDMTEEPDFAAALTEGLEQIAGQIIDSCTFAIPEPPEDEEIDPSLTNVVVTSGTGETSLILQDEVGECTEGWQLNDAGEVSLCPATCDAVQEDGGAEVELTFGCSPEELVEVVQ